MKGKQTGFLILAVIFSIGVFSVIAYLASANVRTVGITVLPPSLVPDGHSEAVVSVEPKNIFGFRAFGKHDAAFVISEGRDSGEIVEMTALTARIRSKLTAGTILLRVIVQGQPIPYQQEILVQPNYAKSEF